MKLNQNVVEKKQTKLARLTKKSGKALALVNKTIDGLASVNADIEQTVAEIDLYQQMLAETRTGLDAELHKNQQIMQNFKSLLCVEYLDSELNTRMFTARLLSNLSGVKYKQLTSGQYSTDEAHRIREAINWLKTRKFTHVYIPMFDQQTIYTAIKKVSHTQGIDVLIVDYFKGKGEGDAFDSYQELGRFVDMIKNQVCGDMGIAGIGAAQATAAGKVADSAKIGRNASTIALIQDKTPEEVEADGTECGNKKLGLFIFISPYLWGAAVDREIQNNALQFLTLEETEATSPMLESAEPTEETIPHAQLREDMNAYNLQLYEQEQSGLTCEEDYRKPSFLLADYGLDSEVFGVIRIPAMELSMPIYLGATTQHMADGAAHMSQTSLPIGGINTNCVISGHRGYNGASYFRYIEKLTVGDVVYITNLWEELTYRVSEIKIIEPNEIDNILIQDGRDLLTLVTCHPYASGGRQRYLVYCERFTDQV